MDEKEEAVKNAENIYKRYHCFNVKSSGLVLYRCVEYKRNSKTTVINATQ